MKKVISNLSVTAFTACSLLLAAGCNQSQQSSTTKTASREHGHEHGAGSDHDHDHGKAEDAHAHASRLPHGGTPVQLGDHGFHLELVKDGVDGRMLAYVLDGHMEKAVNVSATSFELVAKAVGQEHRLTFTAVTNAPNASGGKTSVFSAPATGLANVTEFEGVIPTITLDGKRFDKVTFSYPKGTRRTH